MKASPKLPDLADLRKLCGEFKRRDSPPTESRQPRPGHSKKPCGLGSSGGVWIYQPLYLEPEGSPRPADSISALVDMRPLDELTSEIGTTYQQILLRAYSGDAAALGKLIFIVRGAVAALTQLAHYRAQEVKVLAETLPTWPFLLSLNPQEISHAKEQLRRLRVGTKAPTPRCSGQRLNPQNFWTDLATRAFEVCRRNKSLVPTLQAHCAGARKEHSTRKLWRATIKATFNRLPDGSVVVIPDWLKDCAKLSAPVTTGNFPDWWKAIKLCVLDSWKMFPQEYEKALRQIGRGDDEQWRLRNLAVTEVRRAFRSLVGLR